MEGVKERNSEPNFRYKKALTRKNFCTRGAYDLVLLIERVGIFAGMGLATHTLKGKAPAYVNCYSRSCLFVVLSP